MSIQLDHDYLVGLQNARPTLLSSRHVLPPLGAEAEERIEPELIIPPINTNIDFTSLPKFKLSSHKGLAALSLQPLEKTFNWRDGSGPNTDAKTLSKMALISTPGNQMLCGSCWAISTAEVISDNFVVSGLVDWKPNLSTAYLLINYAQHQCNGGNPAVLLQSISDREGPGILSNSCIDYSWCAENSNCNGVALKRARAMHEQVHKVNLNELIPGPPHACYNEGKFYRFYVDAKNQGPQHLSMTAGTNQDGLKQKDYIRLIKTHIRNNGPVVGAFLVFKNFMKGYFTKGKPNKGLYLENAEYKDDGTVDYGKIDTSKEYLGSHAVAIVGWGTEENVQVDKTSTRHSVPYWFVRNSWTSKWGDKGYFKMPMSPFNKFAQFDMTIDLSTPVGSVQAGGMIIFKTSTPPTKHDVNEKIDKFFNNSTTPRLKPDSFYEKDQKERPKKKEIKKRDGGHKVHTVSHTSAIIWAVVGVLAFLFYLFLLVYLKRKGHEKSVHIIAVCTIIALVVTLIAIGITALVHHNK